MVRIMKALYQSRKAWVGGITVLVTAVFAVWIGPALGLSDEQSAAVATAIVAAGVAVIAGIAVEDVGTKIAGSGRAPPAVLLLLCLAALAATAGGCGQSYVASQMAQLAGMKQLRLEMEGYHDKVLAQVQDDKEQAIGFAWELSLRQAVDPNGNLPLAAVLEKDAKRQGKQAEVRAALRRLDGEFAQRLQLCDRTILLGEFTLDSMGQWTRALSAFQDLLSAQRSTVAVSTPAPTPPATAPPAP
jgi:hypothetical protein